MLTHNYYEFIILTIPSYEYFLCKYPNKEQSIVWIRFLHVKNAWYPKGAAFIPP